MSLICKRNAIIGNNKLIQSSGDKLITSVELLCIIEITEQHNSEFVVKAYDRCWHAQQQEALMNSEV